MTGPVDVFESADAGAPPHRWRDLPPRWRRLLLAGLLVALLVVVAVVAGVVVHDRAVQRRDAARVAVTVTLAVATSSTSPPGGAVNYALLVRNDGPAPLVVTTVRAGSERLVLRPWTRVQRRVEPGLEVQIPVSVRLVCGGVVSRPPAGMSAELRVRRADGSPVVHRGPVRETEPLLDVAATVCAVHPQLQDFELSGPVARPGSG